MLNTIRAERTLLGLSQEELGEKIGKNRSTINRWENDPQGITGEYLVKLSEIFGCTIEYLLGLTEERTPNAVI